MAESGTQVEDRGANEIQIKHPTYIQPGTSAPSNQRAASLKPPRVAVGCSHSAVVNLPATNATRASMRMSLTRVPRAPGLSWNAPPPRRGALKIKRPGSSVNQCCLNGRVSQT